MKILLVPSIFLPSIGGVELNTYELAKHLSKMGNEVTVLSSNWRQWKLPFHEVIDNIDVYRLPFYVFRGTIKSLIAFIICFPVSLFGTFYLIQKLKPNIINIHFVGANAFYILLIHFLKKMPLIVTFCGNEVINVPDPALIGKKGYTKTEVAWMKWIILSLMNRADYITALSGYLLKKAEELNHNISNKSSRIFMSGITQRSAASVSSPESRPFLLAVGRLAKQKGFDLLPEAFHSISINNKEISLVVIGDGPEKESITKKIYHYNLQNRIALKGKLPKSQIGYFYKNCLFSVVPSRWEGLGAVILEAFSYGKPVIATKIGGIPEMVIDGVTGILIESEDIKQLSAAMMKLLADTNLREKLGANAKSFAKEIGDWNNIAQKYYEVYQNVLKKCGNYAIN